MQTIEVQVGRIIALSLFLIGFPQYARAAEGDLVASFSLTAKEMLPHPDHDLMYVTYGNSVAIINTQTMSLGPSANLGPDTRGLALSPDGSTLYVAVHDSNKVMALNSQTLAVTDQHTMPSQPHDLEVDIYNFLYATTTENYHGIVRYNLATHATINRVACEPWWGDVTLDGFLEISRDRKTLYYGQQGFSPATVSRYFLYENGAICTHKYYSGTNGQDLDLSPAENEVMFANAGIARALTPDTLANSGTYAGAGWHEAEYSPDGSRMYLARADATQSTRLAVFDVLTHELIRYYPATANFGPRELETNRSGQYLFVGYNGTLNVIETPEPQSLVLLGAGLMAFVRRRNRRIVILSGDKITQV